jgi:hypothetical protein
MRKAYATATLGFLNAQCLHHGNVAVSEMHKAYATATLGFPKCTGLMPQQH